MNKMMLALPAFVALFALLAAPAVLACTTSQFELADKEDLPRYTFVLFYKPGTPEGDASFKVLTDLAKKWGPRANADFEYVDVTTERGAKIAKYWQVTEFPVTHVISPSGFNLTSLKGKLDEKDIEPLLTSPGKAKLMGALEKQKAVFLVLGKKGMKNFDDNVKAAENAAKSVKDAIKISVGTLTIDPTDPKEAKLVANLGLEKPPESSLVFVTFGKGRAVLQDVEAEGVEERLAFTIQLLSTADQCSMGQEIRGETLLLGK